MLESDGDQKASVDISLEILFQGFKAPPVYIKEHKLKDLPDFLLQYGSQITKLNYTDHAGENNRRLIIKRS